ncbi:hypothetical protein O6H91_20G015000 [Diphasiastrum complanatum]|uniref:Uncharacterized protein n=1 Tax=Diphasiastrum complanatum TaxID=34168 RepID=A0ACC2AMX6_DIPCM|nr:hypothetical protein O6H91_20G015000 [Diphasiastrum complanatum]
MASTSFFHKASFRRNSEMAVSSAIVEMYSFLPARQLSVSKLPYQTSFSSLQSGLPAGSTLQSALLRVRRGTKQRILLYEHSGEANLRISAALTSSNFDSGEESILFAGRHILRSDIQIIGASLITILLAVSNKVIYKMALIPMKNYPFFLAQITTFGYVLVYFCILYFRYIMGVVTKEMLTLPKHHFVALGALEAMGLATGMAAAAILPGASILVLHQVYLIWQLFLSYSFLGKHYTWGQVGGCLLVLFGVFIVISSVGAGVDLQQNSHFWSFLMIVSSGFAAGAAILKEFVFHDATQHLKGASMDLFVVNSFGSGFQALFVLLLLPILSRLRGIPFNQLPEYFRDGSACFFNAGNAIKVSLLKLKHLAVLSNQLPSISS